MIWIDDSNLPGLLWMTIRCQNMQSVEGLESSRLASGSVAICTMASIGLWPRDSSSSVFAGSAFPPSVRLSLALLASVLLAYLHFYFTAQREYVYFYY